MNEYLMAMVAAVPGILLGIAAIRKSQAALLQARNSDYAERLDRQREELNEAKEQIKILTARVDACDEERHRLLRENIELFRRMDEKSG